MLKVNIFIFKRTSRGATCRDLIGCYGFGVKTIAYMGAAWSGRGTNFVALEAVVGGQLGWMPPGTDPDAKILGLEATCEHGPVRLLTVPGMVFRDAARKEILAAADAVVFVADSRAERQDQTLEAWENLQAADRRPPVVVQYNHRDAADARPIAAIEEMLGIQPFLAGQHLKIANPLAMLHPYRFEAVAPRGVGVRETFDAAARAAYLGLPKPDPAFAKAQLDRQIEGALAGALGGRAGAASLAKGALGSEAGKQAYLEASKEAFMAELFQRLERDPAFVEQLAADVTRTAETSILHEVTCVSCKHVDPFLEIAFQRSDAVGPFKIGDELPVDLASVDRSAYVHVRPWTGGQLLVLDGNRCSKCGDLSWHGIVLEGSRLASIWPVALTRATLERCHLATAGIALEAARLAGKHPDDMTPQSTLAILRASLPS